MTRTYVALEDEGESNFAIAAIRSTYQYASATAFVHTFTAQSTRIDGTAADDVLSGTDGADDIRGLGGNDQIYGQGGDDVLRGARGDDTLIGGAGNDRLYGGLGADQLDGGQGADEMYGKGGNDTYVVDHRDDRVIEQDMNGHDTVATYVDYSAPLWIEDLIAVGEDNITIIGNAENNLIVGNSNSNLLEGKSGNDSLVGNEGDDTLIGNKGDDILIGSAGDDHLIGGRGGDLLDGGTGNDALYGNRGSDVFFGGEGDNVLWGGRGSDTFVIEHLGIQFDSIQDFEPGERGDRIVFVEDVLDVGSLSSSLDQYIQITSTAESTTIAVDPDGGGDSFVAVARLENLAGLDFSRLVLADDGSLMINSAG